MSRIYIVQYNEVCGYSGMIEGVYSTFEEASSINDKLNENKSIISKIVKFKVNINYERA